MYSQTSKDAQSCHQLIQFLEITSTSFTCLWLL